ncbi:MAG: ISKra4 family transposase, partial [Albidovulum sp.]|nr:ISKra4 family transposase [Albidovulum sp.]
MAKCIDYFKENRERMRYGSYRKRGMQIGSGVVETSCRHIVGLRLKRPGSRWTLKGANAMLAIKCALAN